MQTLVCQRYNNGGYLLGAAGVDELGEDRLVSFRSIRCLHALNLQGRATHSRNGSRRVQELAGIRMLRRVNQFGHRGVFDDDTVAQNRDPVAVLGGHTHRLGH